MTNDALFWALFDALGYVFAWSDEGAHSDFVLLFPDGDEVVFGRVGNHVFERAVWASCPGEFVHRHVPDWPTDAGAALALCRSLGITRNMELCLMWFPAPDNLSNTRAWFVNGRTDEEIVFAFRRGDAEALSRLALAALTDD